MDENGIKVQPTSKPNFYYGMYRGTVVDNNDPLQLRRVRIKVMPMFEGVNDVASIPWAVHKDGRSIDIPENGSKVWVEFEMGDWQKPVYSGYICGPDGKTVPVEAQNNYPDTKVWKVNTPSGIVIIKINPSNGITISYKGNDMVLECDQLYVSANTINLGQATGYVVTCKDPDQTIVTESHILTSSHDVKAQSNPS